MRISSNATYNDFIKNLGTNAVKVQKTLNQISSLKEVSQSSDNPLLVSKIMNLNVSIAKNKTFSSEIKDSQGWVDTQASALKGINDSMGNIRRLISHSANGTQGVEEIKANKNEIQQEIQGMVEALNTNFDGRYIFGGVKTTEQPFSVVRANQLDGNGDPVVDMDGNFVEDPNGEIVGLKYNGSNTEITREIADGVVVTLPTNGEKIIDGDGMNNFFNDLIGDMNSYLEAPDNAKLSDLSSKIDGFDDLSNKVIEFQTQLDAIAVRLRSAGDRNESDKLSLTATLSERQDVDVAEKYMEYQNQMLAYQATMSMGTKIMQTSILDYVR
jgi:flagellar hook-associated protein 3 FlgL